MVPKFVNERGFPGIGDGIPDQLHAALQSSCGAIPDSGRGQKRTQSYVTEDKLYCVYASNEEAIGEQASVDGFRGSRISRVIAMVDPDHRALLAVQMSP
jgi:hypothetical protein